MIKYLNIILFIAMIVMNYLANALPLNNKTTGELSDSYPNLFVPAGLTFSIWGIIYILLAVYCVLQFTSADKEIISAIGLAFALTCIFNSLWIVCWHYGLLPLSLLVMAGLLVSLIYINMTITGLGSGIIKAAFGIYLGWICIATIANVTALLVNYNWNGFGISQEAWTIIMIATGTIITALTLYRVDNPYIGLVVIWAFAGIIIKRNSDYRSIVITAAAGIAVMAVMTLFVFLRKKQMIS
jgi:hypothetical protein